MGCCCLLETRKLKKYMCMKNLRVEKTYIKPKYKIIGNSHKYKLSLNLSIQMVWLALSLSDVI